MFGGGAVLCVDCCPAQTKTKGAVLLSGWRRGEREGGVAHQAHHRLRRVELLSHEWLRTRRRGRAVLVLVVRAGGRVAAGAVAATAAAIPVRGRGALAVSAASSAAVSAVAAAAAVLGAAGAAAAHRAHPPVALVLVHQVGIVGVVATAAKTGTTAWGLMLKNIGHTGHSLNI